MINFYSSNYNPIKKPFNQIHPEKESNPSNQTKQRASSINIDKVKSQAKVLPYNSVIKKTNNHVLKSISVNKQIKYQKYNGIAVVKSNYNNANINNKNFKNYVKINNNTNPKNERGSEINNYSNNKLRRKMILSVDINNKKNVKNLSQYDLNNNIKFITENQLDNNKTSENNPSNPMSNGAKNNNSNNSNNSKKINNNKITTKSKSISVNHITKNWSQNNLMKSPDRKYNSNALNKYMESSDKKERNSKNSNNNINNLSKTTNLNIKQSFKLLEHNNSNSNHLITSGNNYQTNLTTGNKDKKYIKPNLKNSNSNFLKLNHNNSKYNIYDNNNNYKIMKEVVEIQNNMEKKLKDNITNSKSKKYNTLKNTFEALLKYLGNTIFKSNNVIINILLEKLLIGYHEVVSAFSAENKKLKQINYYLNEQYEKMTKDLFNLNKIIKDRQKQNESLQKKISSLEKGIDKRNISQIQKNNNIKKINLNKEEKFIKKNEQNKKIFELNKKNVEDLDALYFYDKIKDNKKRAISIPKIIIKQREEEQNEEEEEDEYENDEMNRTVIFSNICGMFIELGDIKFISQTFIKIRDAFIL